MIPYKKKVDEQLQLKTVKVKFAYKTYTLHIKTKTTGMIDIVAWGKP